MSRAPLVSCLMVTSGRVELALQAIECFAAQRYRARELIVVTDHQSDGDALARAVVDRRPGVVRFVRGPRPGMTLGELRNLAIDTAQGDLIAQWDDDDLCHPSRLSEQVQALGEHDVACFLTEQWLFFAKNRTLFVVDWRRRRDLSEQEPAWDCIPGTVLFRKHCGVRYPALRRHEDRALMDLLFAAGPCVRVSEAALSVYRHHGANTFEETHFRALTCWAADRSRLRCARANMELAATWFAPFLGDAPIWVVDHASGPAFMLRPIARPVPEATAPANGDLTPALNRRPGPADSRLRLTVAIATWNRAALLRETLASLRDVAIPPGVDWEVLVCNNASTDGTAGVLAGAHTELPLRATSEPLQGKSVALLRLLADARGDWVLFLDDDVLVSRDWLTAYVEGIRRYPRAGVLGGPVRPWLSERPTGLRAWLLREFPWMHGIVEFNQDETISPDHVRFVHGANLAIRRKALEVPDDIDTRRGMFGRTRIAGEDLRLVARVLARGWEGWRLARAAVYHFIPTERSGWHWWLERELAEARSAALDQAAAPRRILRYGVFLSWFVARQAARTVLRSHRVSGRLRAGFRRLGRAVRRLAH